MTIPFSSISCASALAGLMLVTGCASVGGSASQPYVFAHQAKARVYAVPATEEHTAGFEVVPPIGSEGASYWCAAADYARRQLGAGWADEIYVLHGRDVGSVSGRADAVVFTLSPVMRASDEPILRRPYAFEPGDSFDVTEAAGLCQEINVRVFGKGP